MFLTTITLYLKEEIFDLVFPWFSKNDNLKNANQFKSRTQSRQFSYTTDGSVDGDFENFMHELGDIKASRYNINKLQKFYILPVSGTRFFSFKGRMLVFKRMVDEGKFWSSRSEVISIFCLGWGRSVLHDLLKKIRLASVKKKPGEVSVYRPVLFNSPRWKRQPSIRKRDLDSMVLQKNIKNTMLKYCKIYQANEKFCKKKGISYREGMLFFGFSGTEKSFCVVALAARFNRDIYVLDFMADEMNSGKLTSLFNNIPKHDVLLLEDIDRAEFSAQRSMPNNTRSPVEDIKLVNINLGSFLNAIDGVLASGGYIIIMTANSIEMLEKAMIRPGRVDQKILFLLANRDMLYDIGFFILENGELAQYLADALSENRHSVADIERYLLSRRKAPRDAIHRAKQVLEMTPQ